MGRHRFAALTALLLEPRTVVVPITRFSGPIMVPGLILQSPSVLGVDDRIKRPHHRLQTLGRSGGPDSNGDGTDHTEKANHNRAHTASNGFWISSPKRGNGHAAAFPPVVSAASISSIDRPFTSIPQIRNASPAITHQAAR